MSGSAIINRGIKINSPGELYKILKKYSYLCKDDLKKFKDIYYLVLHGCGCDKEKNTQLSNQLYLNLQNVSDSLIVEFKTILQVNFVQFNFNGKEVFRW